MQKKLLVILLILCLLPAAALADVHVEETPPEDWAERDLMRLTVFRTGEGDCMLLEAGGECMMIDGGPYKYREKLRTALEARGISHFRYLFSTHPHDDHINGLKALMAFGFTADEFVSVFPKDQHDVEENQKKTVAVMEKAGIPYRQVASGDVLPLGGAAVTVINWPEGYSINARSAMTRIEYGACSALLCADIIGDTQQHFLKTLDPALLKADVIKTDPHDQGFPGRRGPRLYRGHKLQQRKNGQDQGSGPLPQAAHPVFRFRHRHSGVRRHGLVYPPDHGPVLILSCKSISSAPGGPARRFYLPGNGRARLFGMMRAGAAFALTNAGACGMLYPKGREAHGRKRRIGAVSAGAAAAHRGKAG